MADLTGTTPADTYKGLLQVNDYTNGVDATAKYIQDGEGTDSVLALSTDKVGIGTTSPRRSLEIQIADNTAYAGSGAGNALIIANTSQASDSFSSIEMFAGLTTTGGANIARIFAVKESTTTPATSLAFITRDSIGDVSERMRIDSDGNVGIGTTSPEASLNVAQGPSIAGLDLTNACFLAGTSVTGIGVDDNEIVKRQGTGGGQLNIVSQGSAASIVLKTGANPSNNNLADERMRIDSDGNVGIGTTSFGTSAAGVFGIKNGTAPTSSPADMVQLYAKDDAGSSRLYVRNEAGTETVLSPHAADAPSSLYDRPPGVEEMHRSANYYLGTIVFTNVDRRNSLMQKQLNGEELPEDRTFTITETFADYNARTGAELQVEDWDANQQAMADADESYVKKPTPDWLS